ncbi:MAG: NADH-quinone oxidoreductase subunit I [Candidatus Omnitrophica bacterium]|nr:NADH-quinone oxidoreductase subunit I [Candidatus Omnitrophota bacterium]MCM8828763.1 NADH-quinone oxidoreductase subunit I [Candidatus Omnitrophota bacterium]
MKLKLGVFIPELLRHLFKRPSTVSYPFEKLNLPKDFRGTPVLRPELCIVCKSCVRDCPAFAIEIETLSEEEKKYRMTIHNDRCIHCAQCVESCPTGALYMNDEYEIATDSRRKLKIEYIYTRPKKAAQKHSEK